MYIAPCRYHAVQREVQIWFLFLVQNLEETFVSQICSDTNLNYEGMVIPS